MQYFTALKIGQRRVKSAQDILKTYTGSAMPALALKDNKSDQWEPVGEREFLRSCKGIEWIHDCNMRQKWHRKSLANWFTEKEKINIIAK